MRRTSSHLALCAATLALGCAHPVLIPDPKPPASTAPPFPREPEPPFLAKQSYLYTIPIDAAADSYTVPCTGVSLAKRSGPTPAPWLRQNQRQRRLAKRRRGL